MPKKVELAKPEEENKEPKQEVMVVQRAVPIEDMFNHLSDKLNLVLTNQQELIKIAKEE